jgi:uncharacterized protein YaaQ
MKIVLAIVQSIDAPVLVAALSAAGHQSTLLSTTGGFLRSGNSTVLTGVAEDGVDEVVDIIGVHCKPRVERSGTAPRAIQPGELQISPPSQVEVGGAVVFVLDVERFERI